MPFPLIQENEPDGYWNRRAGDMGTGGAPDALDATVSGALDRTAAGSLARMYALESMNRIEGQRTLSVEELNDKYNGSGITWTSPQREYTAEYIAREHDRRGQLDRRKALAGGGVGQGILNFAAENFILALDMLLSGGLAGAGIRGLGISAGTGLAARMGMGFAENSIGMIPGETLSIMADRQAQMDVSLSTSLANVAMGGAFGAGLEGARFGFNRLKVDERVRAGARAGSDFVFKPEERARMTEIAAAQLAEGKIPIIGRIAQMLRRQKEGVGPRPEVDYSGRSESKFVNHGAEEIISGQFYNGTASRAEDQAHLPPVTTPYGTGQVGTNSLFHENAKSVPDKGLIHQYEVNGRLAPLDAPIPDGIKKILGDMSIGEKPTLREVYKGLPPELVENLNQNLQQAGYDGVHGIEGDVGSERNHTLIFKERAATAITRGGALEGDPRFVGEPSKQEWNDMLEEYHAPQNDLFHSEEQVVQRAEAVKRAEETDYEEPAYVDEHHQQTIDLASKMAKEGELPPEGQALLDQIKERQAGGKIPKGQVSPTIEGEERAIAEEIAKQKLKGEPIKAGDVFKGEMKPEEPTYGEKAKEGEKIIKALYNCIGGE